MAEQHPSTPTDPRDFVLIQSAFGMYERGEFEWAVVALQTAVEVVVEQRVAQMLEWRELGSLGDAIGDVLVRNYRFTDGRFKALWAALTGDTPETLAREQGWWSGYMEHVRLRDQIVHRGATASERNAEQSMEAALGAISYVQNTSIRIGVELGQLRELGTAGRPRQHLPDHDRRDAGA
jgi:hypothetical protein